LARSVQQMSHGLVEVIAFPISRHGSRRDICERQWLLTQ
jgi:hypothetical protein